MMQPLNYIRQRKHNQVKSVHPNLAAASRDVRALQESQHLINKPCTTNLVSLTRISLNITYKYKNINNREKASEADH